MGKGGSKMLKKRWLSFVIMITFVFTVFAGVTVLAEQTENSNVFVINEAYFNDAGKLYISYTSNGELSNAVLFVVTYEDSSEKIITDCANLI